MGRIYLYSALLLTGLLVVGLIFFIKASTKDRTETWLVSASPQVVKNLENYLLHRGYCLVARSPEQSTLTWQGQVRPSVWLMLLLGGLAGVGVVCLGLVMMILLPQLWSGSVQVFVVVLAIALTCSFYWRGANRPESIRILAGTEDKLSIQAHRDELREMQRSLGIAP